MRKVAKHIRDFARANIPGGGLAISRDGERAAVGGSPGTEYDVESGEVIRETPAGHSVAFSPDGERLAIASDDWEVGNMELRVVAADSGRIVSRARAHAETGGTVAYSPDGKYVATAGYDHTARLWDPATGKEVRRFLAAPGGTPASPLARTGGRWP